MRDLFHGGTPGPHVAQLKYFDLFQYIVGVLPRQTRESFIAFTTRAVACSALHNTFVRNARREDFLSTGKIGTVVISTFHGRLRGKVIGQFIDLFACQVRETPHVLRTACIAAIMAFEIR